MIGDRRTRTTQRRSLYWLKRRRFCALHLDRSSGVATASEEKGIWIAVVIERGVLDLCRGLLRLRRFHCRCPGAAPAAAASEGAWRASSAGSGR